MPFADRVADYQSRIESVLDRVLPPAGDEPQRLHAAMRYAVLGGGKRVRPILVYAGGEAFGVAPPGLDGAAAAVELIHAYSLVHDDLPAMDDDDLRRGRPTCHRQFDEATAILAGDALQALAFDVLAGDTAMRVGAATRIRMLQLLAQASGSAGMAGGQAIDLAAVGRDLDLPALENMHRRKTGALIRASVELGAWCADSVDAESLTALSRYAECIGLAFQIRDDIIDIESDTETLGKPQGSDQAHNKPTYPRLLGLDGAKQAALRMHREALGALQRFDARADGLRWIADYIVSRAN
jgi:farnesyl diphosphate synthase